MVKSTLAFLWPSGAGFTIEYPRITLHAVSRGEDGPSVYCQLDESDPSGATNGAEENEEEEDTEMREMKIIPSDPTSGEHYYPRPPPLLTQILAPFPQSGTHF